MSGKNNFVGHVPFRPFPYICRVGVPDRKPERGESHGQESISKISWCDLTDQEIYNNMKGDFTNEKADTLRISGRNVALFLCRSPRRSGGR
jgi:hypothetical protein